MSITLLYGCCQIETTARNLNDTRRFFCDVLGAGPIEQVLAKQIDSIAPDTNYGCDHLGLGEAVFQINQPDPSMVFNGHKSIHQAYLDRAGPCVTNLNFFVDDHAHARRLLTSLGSTLHLDGPSSAARALADYGPRNSRPGGDERPFMFVGTRHLFGLDLEIMEPNFLRFVEQSVQYPAYVQPRPTTGDDNLYLQRMRIVVADLEQTLANLENAFTPGCRSKPYAYREGASARAFRVGLGGMEIEYTQPLSADGEVARFYERFGPGVITLEFAARDFDNALERCWGRAAVSAEPDWFGDAQAERSGRHMISSRDTIGFDVVLEPYDERRLWSAG